MRPRQCGYFAFARFSTTTREAVLNPSFEINLEAKEAITCYAPIAPQALGVNRRLRLWPRLANLLRCCFFFAPGEEPLDHIESYWDQEDCNG
jgi:hypothetical protein